VAATGAGAADSAGGNRSSGGVVSFFASTLSRTGLVAEFAGEVDSNWCVEQCEEACGMLRFDIEIKIRSTRKPQGNALLWIRNRRPYSVLWTDAGFGQSIITRVKVLAILQHKRRQSNKETKGQVFMPNLLHLGEDILMGREFAIQTEEFLLLLRQLLYNERSTLSAMFKNGLTR
jgi:hypothetical protein